LCAQLSVDVLLSKADAMFPEGQGAVRAFARDGGAAEKTNELLENATTAINQLFEQRGYDPKKPDETTLCRTQKRFRHDSRIAARSRLSDSFPLDPYTHAPHGATEAARPLR